MTAGVGLLPLLLEALHDAVNAVIHLWVQVVIVFLGGSYDLLHSGVVYLPVKQILK
jgi:hypothetical protein